MNRIIEIAAIFLGGASLFTVSFVGFAAMAGVPLREIPVFGGLVPEEAPAEALAPPPTVQRSPRPDRSDVEVIESGLGALGAWSLPAPYTADELRGLVEELKAKLLVLERREAEVTRREAEVEEQLETLAERFASLEALRAELEAYERELDLRAEEVRAAESRSQEADLEKWRDVGTVLAALEPEEAATKLVQYPPDEAGIILRAMDETKAAAILNAVSTDRWKDYVDAYTRAARSTP